MPVNLFTINQIYHSQYSPEEAKLLIENEKSKLSLGQITNFEDKAKSLVGAKIYEALYKGYTKKQWQTDPKLLPAEIAERLPVRYNYDNRYFSDKWQGIPSEGYLAWFERMIDHERIQVDLGCDFFDVSSKFNYRNTINSIPIFYTGPLDRYFQFAHGKLSWRTLDFKEEKLDLCDFQGTSVMNYADEEIVYTRIHEFKHLHPERRDIISSRNTVVYYEFSRNAGNLDEPYYPINSLADRKILLNYRELAKKEKSVYFGGRLGTYKYLDMHMAIGSALTLWEKVYRGGKLLDHDIIESEN